MIKKMFKAKRSVMIVGLFLVLLGASTANAQSRSGKQKSDFERNMELGRQLARENERSGTIFNTDRGDRVRVSPQGPARDTPSRNSWEGSYDRHQPGRPDRSSGGYNPKPGYSYSGTKAPADRYTGLNAAEKSLVFNSPGWVAQRVYSAKNKALVEAQRRYPGSINGGLGDAFRHAYWSALLARDLGPIYAQRFTDAHENFAGNPPKDKAMDMHNNSVGIRIGSANRGASDQELIGLVERALRGGSLIARSQPLNAETRTRVGGATPQGRPQGGVQGVPGKTTNGRHYRF